MPVLFFSAQKILYALNHWLHHTSWWIHCMLAQSTSAQRGPFHHGGGIHGHGRLRKTSSVVQTSFIHPHTERSAHHCRQHYPIDYLQQQQWRSVPKQGGGHQLPLKTYRHTPSLPARIGAATDHRASHDWHESNAGRLSHQGGKHSCLEPLSTHGGEYCLGWGTCLEMTLFLSFSLLSLGISVWCPLKLRPWPSWNIGTPNAIPAILFLILFSFRHIAQSKGGCWLYIHTQTLCIRQSYKLCSYSNISIASSLYI